MAFPVEAHDLPAGDVNAGSREDVDFHSGVGQVLLFLRRRRLDLGEVKAAIVWCEDVDRDERVVGKEAGFEDRRRAVVDPLARERDALIDGVVRQIDEDATGEHASCQRADLCSLIKAILEHLVRLELNGERLVDFPPEQLMALGAGGAAGFGQAVRHRNNVWGRYNEATLDLYRSPARQQLDRTIRYLARWPD